MAAKPNKRDGAQTVVKYELRNGTIMENVGAYMVKNPTTKRNIDTRKAGFKKLLADGDVRIHEPNTVVSIELGYPLAKAADRTKVYVRIQGKLTADELQKLQTLKVLDPESPLGRKLTNNYGRLFANINSNGALPIIRITSRLDVPQGYNLEYKRLAHDVETQPYLCSDYVQGGLPMMVGDLKDEYQPNACALNLLLESCAKSIPKKYQTVAELARLAGIPEEHQYKINLNELKKLSDRFKIRMTFIKSNGALICKYIPEKFAKNNAIFRAVIDNDHVWLVNNNVRRFDEKYGGKLTTNHNVGYADHDEKEQFINWQPSETKPFEFIVKSAKDAVDIAKVNGSEVVAVCSLDMEKLITELYIKFNVYAGKIRITNGIITSFSINVNRALIIKYVQQQDDEPNIPEVETLEQANLINEYMEQAADILMPAKMVSTYNDAFNDLLKNFPRTPICGRFNDNKSEFYTQFDQSKAYSTMMYNIDYVPAFSKHSKMYKTTTQEVEQCCFYYAMVSRTDPYVAPSKFNLFYYTTVEFLRSEGVEVVLIAIYRPIKIIDCHMDQFVQKLYDDSRLSEQNKKAIMNMTYGLSGRTQMKYTDGYIYKRTHEFDEQAEIESHYTFDLSDNLVCGYKQKCATYRDGFKHMSRIILEAHRISMYKLAKVITYDGTEHKRIIAIRTDAFYCKCDDTQDIVEALEAAHYEFGKKTPMREQPSITITENATPPETQYEDNQNEHGQYEFAEPPTYNIEDFILTDEYDIDEVSEIVLKKNVVFAGAYAGVGKTTTAIMYCDHNGLSFKIVSPYGRLRTKLVNDGHSAYTLDRFIGRSTGKYKVAPISVDGVDVVIFDELYLCDELQLESIGKFIKQNPQVQIIATGDLYQLPPVGCTSVITLANARDLFFGTHFNARITLNKIKRITDETEKERMMIASDYLKRERLFSPDFLEQFEHIKFSDLTAEDAKYTHITFTNDMRSRVNDKLENLVNKPIAVGDVFLSVRCDEYEDYKGEIIKNNLNSQDEYKINEIYYGAIEFIGKHKVSLSHDNYRRYMTRPYAITCNSSQGLGLGDRIYIHETNHGMMTNVWLRTAITRSGTYSGIVIVAP